MQFRLGTLWLHIGWETRPSEENNGLTDEEQISRQLIDESSISSERDFSRLGSPDSDSNDQESQVGTPGAHVEISGGESMGKSRDSASIYSITLTDESTSVEIGSFIHWTSLAEFIRGFQSEQALPMHKAVQVIGAGLQILRPDLKDFLKDCYPVWERKGIWINLRNVDGEDGERLERSTSCIRERIHLHFYLQKFENKVDWLRSRPQRGIRPASYCFHERALNQMLAETMGDRWRTLESDQKHMARQRQDMMIQKARRFRRLTKDLGVGTLLLSHPDLDVFIKNSTFTIEMYRSLCECVAKYLPHVIRLSKDPLLVGFIHKLMSREDLPPLKDMMDVINGHLTVNIQSQSDVGSFDRSDSGKGGHFP